MANSFQKWCGQNWLVYKKNMSYYPSDFIENLRLKSDLVSLISEDTVLKGRGDRLMGLCPFPDHNEKPLVFLFQPVKVFIIVLAVKAPVIFSPICSSKEEWILKQL